MRCKIMGLSGVGGHKGSGAVHEVAFSVPLLPGRVAIGRGIRCIGYAGGSAGSGRELTWETTVSSSSRPGRVFSPCRKEYATYRRNTATFRRPSPLHAGALHQSLK